MAFYQLLIKKNQIKTHVSQYCKSRTEKRARQISNHGLIGSNHSHQWLNQLSKR